MLQDEKVLIKRSTTGRFVTTDIQRLKNIRNHIFEQLENDYKKEVQSYGNFFEKEVR